MVSDYKTCPLKTMSNFCYEPETPEKVEVATGICTESSCAWWDNLKECCAMLTIARSSRQK